MDELSPQAEARDMKLAATKPPAPAAPAAPDMGGMY